MHGLLKRILRPAVRVGVGALSKFGYTIRPIDQAEADMPAAFLDIFERCQSYTMTTRARMFAMYEAVQHVVRAGVPGDVVECGVWKGGTCMLAAMTLDALGEKERRIYLYDTFAGMTQPTDDDVDYRGVSARDEMPSLDWVAVGIDEVRANMRSTGFDEQRTVFVPGKVEQTLPKTVPDRIALLRLDTDWYESTYQEMVHLFARLSPGGILILDDYGHWLGSRKAVDRYMQEHGVAMFLARIDHGCRIGVKA